MSVPAAPVSVQTCPPAASTRRTGEPASRWKLQLSLSLGGGASHLAPARLSPRRPAVPREPSWGPRGRTGWGPPGPPGLLRHAGGARAARAARPRPRVRDLTAALSSQLRAHTGVMAERQPQAKFPGADGLPLQPKESSSLEKQRGGHRSARGQPEPRRMWEGGTSSQEPPRWEEEGAGYLQSERGLTVTSQWRGQPITAPRLNQAL